jgi:hypothetical protein
LEQVATPTGRSPLIGTDKIKTEISKYIQKRKLQNSCKIYNRRIGNVLGGAVEEIHFFRKRIPHPEHSD